jgi:hypothetical protein
VKTSIKILAAAMIGLFSTNSYASNFIGVQSTVARVDLADGTQSGTTGVSLSIYFTDTTQQTMCGSAVGFITINAGGSLAQTTFDAWTRTAQEAYLSGRLLRIGTSNSNTGGACKVSYVSLSN